jgi:hypothetical protein
MLLHLLTASQATCVQIGGDLNWALRNAGLLHAHHILLDAITKQ